MKRLICYTLVTLTMISFVFLWHMKNEESVLLWNEVPYGKLSGAVIDEEKQPLLSQLKIFTADGQFIKCEQSDEKGNFSFFLEEGHYYVEVSKGFEYEIKKIPLEVKSQQEQDLEEISLKRLVDWGSKDYYCGDLHQHSHFSIDGVNCVEEVWRANQAAGLSFGALSDHHSVDGVEEWLSLSNTTSFLGIPSQEVTTNEGHYLALNVKELVDVTQINSEEELHELIHHIHTQGGIIELNHPGRQELSFEVGRYVDAIEIWNGAAMPPTDTIKVLNKEYAYNLKSKEMWFDLLSQGIKVTALGNSDCHNIQGFRFMTSEEENEVVLKWMSEGWGNGSPRNYVKVDELSVDGILNGIREGHVFITNGPLMDITVNEVTFGDTLTGVNEVEISYLITSNQTNLKALNIIADGKVIEEIPLAQNMPSIGTLTIDVARYQWILFEVLTDSYEYAISNPVYFQ